MAKNNKTESFKWGEAVLGFIKNFIKEISHEAIDSAKLHFEKIVLNIRNSVLVMFFLFFGFIFLMIGVSILLSQLTGIDGLGYIFVGFMAVIFGFIIKNLSNK